MSAPSILVVDDNPTNLKLVSDLLECEGYEILKAADAEEAQLIIAHQVPDLLLLDIALPGMDGLTLTRKLRSEERTRSLSIVALTAFAMKGDAEKAHAAGCNGYITKPIDTRSLPGLVAGYLPIHHPAPPERGLRILVIEDSPAELKLAELILVGAGHKVSGIDAARHAMETIKQSKPEMILLDLLLPDLDGLSLVRILKSDAETSAIPIVAVTSFPERFPKAEALAAGCDAYLVKPLSSRQLPGQIQNFMNGTAS